MQNRNINFQRSARLFRLVPALAVTALIAVIMEVSGAWAEAFTVGDLNGGYADSSSGFVPLPNRPGTPVSSCLAQSGIGRWTFDGAGNLSASLILNNGGNTVHPTFTGTYTVNADGTGTIDWVSFGTPRRRTFVIGDGGNQIRWLQTDPVVTGAVVGGTMVKQ